MKKHLVWTILFLLSLYSQAWCADVTLTVSNDGNGTTNITESSVSPGKWVSIQATSSTGYRFKTWTSSTKACPIDDFKSRNSMVFVQDDCTVTAHFLPIEFIPITTTTSSYTIKEDHHDDSGVLKLLFTFTAPASGRYRIHVDTDDTRVNTRHCTSEKCSSVYVVDDYRTYTIKSEKGDVEYFEAYTNYATSYNSPVSVYYEAAPFSVTSTSDGNGTVKTSNNRFFKDERASIYATGNDGFKFDHWEVKSGPCTLSDSHSATTSVLMGNGNCAVQAHFIQSTIYSITEKAVEYVVNKNYYDDQHTWEIWYSLTAPEAGFYAITYSSANLSRMGLAEIFPMENPTQMSTGFAVNTKTIYSIFDKDQTKFFGVTVGSLSNPFTIKYEFIPLTVSSDKNGSAQITSTTIYDTSNEKAYIKAIPNEGYTFNGWTVEKGNCTIGSPTQKETSVTHSTECEVKANFVKRYLVNITNNGNGYTTGSAYVYEESPTKTIWATPSGDYRFQKWTSSQGCSIKDPLQKTTTVTVSDNCEITGIFEPAKEFPITDKSTEYTFEKNYFSARKENEVHLSFTAPDNGKYRLSIYSPFTGVEIHQCSRLTTTSSSCTIAEYQTEAKVFKKDDVTYFRVTAPTNATNYASYGVNAYYTAAPSLEVTGNDNGIAKTDANHLFEGEKANISATGNSGYKFEKWNKISGSCSITDENSRSTTVTMGQDNCSIKASFVQANIYALTTSPIEYTTAKNYYEDARSDEVWYSLTAPEYGLYAITVSKEQSAYLYLDEIFPEEGSISYSAYSYSTTKKVYSILNKAETKYFGYKNSLKTPFTAKYEIIPFAVVSDENGSVEITSRELYEVKYEKVSFKATPHLGYVFKNWEVLEGSCKPNSTSASTYTTYNTACKIKANFERLYQVSVSSEGQGSATISKTSVTKSNNIVEVTAKPESGYKLQSWAASSESCVIDKPLASTAKVTINDDCEIKATFAAAKIISITEEPAQYTIAENYYSGIVANEVRFSLTAPEDQRYKIRFSSDYTSPTIKHYTTQSFTSGTIFSNDYTKSLKKGDIEYFGFYATTSPYSAYLTKKITVYYEKASLLTVKANSNGSVTSSANFLFEGENSKITAVADSGYKFSNWKITSGTCSVADENSKSTTVTMGEDKCTVVAIFIPGTIHQLTTNPVEYVNTEDYYDDVHENAVWFKLTAEEEGLYSITVTRDDITFFSLYEIDPFSSNQNITITQSSGFTKTIYSSFSKGETKYFQFYDSHSSAHFSINYEYIPFIISASDGGTIEITSRNAISTGERINIKAIPDSNFMVTIQTISGTCQKYSPVNNIYTIDYNSACEVKFNFKREYYDLTFVQNGNGTTEESQKIRASANSMYIHAVPDDGNAFRKWTSSSELCVIDAPTAATSKITVNDDCTITAYFEKTFQLTISNNGNGSTSPSTETVAESSPEVKISATANEEYKFKQWTSSSEGCVIENPFFAETIVNVGDDCNIEAEFAPAEVYVLTETATTYNYNEHFYGLSTVSLDYSAIRYNFAFPDTGWYYIQIDYVDNLNAILYDFGSDISFETLQKTDSIINPKRFFIKGDEKDHYWAIRDSLDNHPDKSFNIKIDKATYSIVTIQTGRQGSGDPVGNISVLQGYDTVITARPYIGYIFDKWIDSDNCMSIETPNSATSHVFAKSDSCSIQATYTIDPSIVPIVTVNRIDSSEAPKFQASISITDSATGKSLNGIDYGSFTISVDGKPISFDANSIQKNINGNMEEEYFITFEIQDSIMNGDDHDITIAVAFGSRTSKNSSKLTEPLWVAKDVVDSFKLYGLNSDSSKINRSTDKIKITLTSQNFTSGKDSAKVTITCKNSRDIETLLLQEKKDGLFEATIEKDERPGKKNDKKLSCSIADTIIVEYTDPVYQIVSRDTVVFADSIHNTYEFLDEQLKTELDSVEDYETTFGFRVTALSPTLYEADTIKVLMFTNAGDSAWFDAVETGAYTSTFEGIGNFKYVATQSEMFKDSLDATLNLDSTITRIKIQAQVDNDNSKLNKRDSLIVTSTFIPADSAELYDRDLDGRADFVRIHFASSIAQEDIFVKGAHNISKTKDFSWIEAELKEPYEYGYTVFNKDSIPFVLVSRASSNIVQKVALTDRTGAVPLIANKISGVVASDGYLGEEKKNQPDTLLITMSEVVHYDSSSKSYMDLFYYSETCDSENIKEIHLLEEPIVDSTGLVWTLILNPEAILKTGFCIKTNNKSPYKDVNDNSNGIGGVVITGDNGKQYLYEIVANPSVSGIGKRARWISPESGEWEDVPDTISCLKTETRFAYTADILIFDAQGHYITTLKQEFGKHGELEDSRRENEHNETKYAYLYWNQRSSEGNIVGTGVYIWKIKFTFADGHKESRTIRTGVRRTH